ncbi:MAG: type IV pili methyl-accepting chemotaxis transducer N-terminal domain-containing protein, partial [Bacteroidota bacterium]
MGEATVIEETGVFQRLRRSYLLALSLIALSLLAEHLLVESFLEEQARDANIINVAGRQRMLSQRITKLSILPPDSERTARLVADIREWHDRHAWLKDQLPGTPVLPRLVALDSLMQELADLARTQDAGSVVHDRSEAYLSRMDAIVNEISVAATARVNRLRQTKQWITVGVGVVLLLELLFIFQPINRFVQRQFAALRQEKSAQTAARALAEQAAREKATSLRELRALNQAIDRAALFATLRSDGSVIHLSRKFADLLGWKAGDARRPTLAEWLHPDEGRRAYFSEHVAATRAGDWHGEWCIENRDGKTFW